MKLSVSINLLDFARLVGRVIISSRGLYLYTNTEKAHAIQTLNINSLSVIRTHGPGVSASEDSSCLRPLGYPDRHNNKLQLTISTVKANDGLPQDKYIKAEINLISLDTIPYKTEHAIT
jgi:hypothetical protein